MALSYKGFSSSEQVKQREPSLQVQKVLFLPKATAGLPCKHNIFANDKISDYWCSLYNMKITYFLRILKITYVEKLRIFLRILKITHFLRILKIMYFLRILRITFFTYFENYVFLKLRILKNYVF